MTDSASPPGVLWLDAPLSHYLPAWITEQTGIPCQHLLELGLREATDRQIFQAGRTAGATIVTKDRDYGWLIREQGPPPQVILLTCGNVSITQLKALLLRGLPAAWRRVQAGEPLVELVIQD